MPTTRKRVTRKIVKTALSDYLRAYLLTGEREKADVEVFRLSGSPDRLQVVWDAVKNELTKDWIKQNPASRPWLWWQYDAPKERVKCWINTDIREAQRLRIGGTGTPSYEVLAYVPYFRKGVPSGWISEFDVAYYNGKGKDVHGKRIGTEYKKGDFKAVAYDRNDPPIFESEASYLERHGLLSDKEKTYLLKHKDLLKPEKVEFEED
jgi:hypothetical protein